MVRTTQIAWCIRPNSTAPSVVRPGTHRRRANAEALRVRFTRRGAIGRRRRHRTVTMIVRHYRHLARDGREHAIKLLDNLTAADPALTEVTRRLEPWDRGGRTLEPAGRSCLIGLARMSTRVACAISSTVFVVGSCFCLRRPARASCARSRSHSPRTIRRARGSWLRCPEQYFSAAPSVISVADGAGRSRRPRVTDRR